MTHLLDLPNELLYMVATKLNCDSRRRFSKVNSRLLTLIRGQNGLRSDIRRNVMTTVTVHQHEDCCTVRWTNESTDLRAFVFYSESSTILEIQHKVRGFLAEFPESADGVTWTSCDNFLEKAKETLSKGTEYYYSERGHYTVTYEHFNLPIATELLTLAEHCCFDIEGCDTEEKTVDDLFLVIYALFLAADEEYDEGFDHPQLTVTQRLRPLCHRPFAEELARMDESKQEIVETVRSMCNREKAARRAHQRLHTHDKRQFRARLHDNNLEVKFKHF